MNGEELVRMWKTSGSAGAQHPAGELELGAIASVERRAMLLTGFTAHSVTLPGTGSLSLSPTLTLTGQTW